ncbi:DEAD/DEAH box helicase [Geosmithia morbida]|uniref:DEAD/DEAH box helicase n=1 Tax=Geosmithia morbida TaxID=1094350 RepID=A0A9P5D549_9HYPO|nr:DEAD/DEAH box helicase [Geosmithia morbida]KAF4124201.1 DEAD/DEAH box helicase [Geosmithia morbida]
MSTDRSSTPADKVADTAADVADTAQELDGPGLEPTDAAGSPEHHEPKTPLFSHENLSSYESMLDGSRQDTRSRLFSHEDLSPYDATVDDSRQDPRCRLFSHESLGAYEPLDDDIYNECPDMAPATPEPLQRTKSSASSFAVDDATDMNDPTIETFPSDRLSVMSTLRKIQSSSSQDHAVDVQEPYSPRFGSGTCNSGDPRIRRLSGDSADDGSNYLAEPPINHKMVPFPRRRDSRASHGSLDRGATSLGAIAEEPKKVAGNPSTTQY